MEKSKTQEDKIKEYNQIIDDEKSSNKLDISDAAFKIALIAGRSEVFPPFGIISFDDEEKSSEQLADQTIKGTQSFYNNILGKEKTENLIDNPAIVQSPVFEGSQSVQDLQAKTKTEFSKILDSYQEKGEGKENKDTKNEKSVENLDSESLKKILSSTMVDFLKEIGIKRESREKDDLIAKQSGENVIKRIQEKTDNYDENKNSLKNNVNSLISSIVPNFTTDVKIPSNNIISNNTNNAITSSSVTPLININNSTLQKQVSNNTLPSISSTQTNVNNTNTSNNTNSLQKNTSENILNPVTKTSLTSITPSIVTPIVNNESVDKGESAAGEGPISSSLFESLGITKEEGQAIFRNADPSSIENGIYQTFSKENADKNNPDSTVKSEIKTINSNQNTILKNDVNTISSPASAKIIKDEPTKILNPTPPRAETKKTEDTVKTDNKLESNNNSENKNETITQKEESKESFAASETKNESSSRNEGGENINAQLLSVMYEILKTLKGPLIVSEDKPRFF